MANVSKERKIFCKDKKCKKHTLHRAVQYKAGKASNFAQGAELRRDIANYSTGSRYEKVQ